MTTTTGAWIFGGTGLSLADLDAKPRHDRKAILAGTISLLREKQLANRSPGMTWKSADAVTVSNAARTGKENIHREAAIQAG